MGATTHDVDAEVVIVGAGPAGCVLGYLLARSGVETLLCERNASFEREFRGYGFTPAAVDLFEQMGLLDRILELDHDTVRRPEVTVFGTVYQLFDFGDLPYSPGYALLMEQPALLECIVAAADAYDNFTFRRETTVTDLRTEADRVVGVEAADRLAGEGVSVGARLVVGADGRYSTVREVAGIDPGLFDSDLELVWFKLPRASVDAAAQARIDDAGLVLYFGLGSDAVQGGWFIEAGTYPALRAAGIDAFRERLAAVDPGLRPTLAAHLRSFEQCSLLHIAPGISDEWTRDGLALVGDAAHVASPIGAQGNALAIQDAVVLHRVLVALLRERGARATDVVPAARLARFEARRRPAVERTVRAQRRGERVLTWLVESDERLPSALKRPLFRSAVRVLPRLPGVERAVTRFALGRERLFVDTRSFVDASE